MSKPRGYVVAWLEDGERYFYVENKPVSDYKTNIIGHATVFNDEYDAGIVLQWFRQHKVRLDATVIPRSHIYESN